MAETSYFWDNAGTGDSPAGGYGSEEMMEAVFRMLLNGTGDQGVLKNWLNELEVTDGGVDTATVLTGAAIVYGYFYESDANVDVDVNAFRGGNCHIVVEASWAAQTVRLAAVAALTQTVGTTYDIPLAELAVDGAGGITISSDDRDYCEFSTEILSFAATTDSIQDDAAITDKLIDKARRFQRGVGCMQPDATSPMTWTSNTTTIPYHDAWVFADAATNSGWITFRVPADFSGTDLDVYLMDHAFGSSGNARWSYDVYYGAASAVLANDSGSVTQTGPIGGRFIGYTGQYASFWNLCTLTVSAGDIVHMKISRVGADAADTLAVNLRLMCTELRYTADS